MENPNQSKILLHEGEQDLPYQAMNPPICQTSNFYFQTFDEFQQNLQDETKARLYTRGNNPTIQILEEKLAHLEHAEQAKVVASGVAAITNAILAFLKKGDHCIYVNESYTWAKTFFQHYLPRFGVSATPVSGNHFEEFIAQILPNTKLIYLESPTSLTFKLQNLRAISQIAHEHQILTIIDNTWATPLYQNPIDFGIDLVVHSISKYLGGHSDVVAGVILGKKTHLQRIFTQEFLNLGPVPDPHSGWLILRGLRTLHVRMPVHFQNGLQIANFLSQHPKVERVLHPFLKSHPQHQLALQQMTGGAGLFSFYLKNITLNHLKQFVNSFTLFKRAVSWGGYESLIFPKAVSYSQGTSIPPHDLNLIRLHVGLEDLELLKADLQNALNKI